MFLIKIDVDLFIECGSLKNGTIRLCSEFKNELLEKIEEFFDCIKEQEESVIERIPTK